MPAPDREATMKKWDRFRAMIAAGDAGSYPRDWFESELDARDERINELEAEIKKLKEPWTHTDVYDEGYHAGFLDGQEKPKQ